MAPRPWTCHKCKHKNPSKRTTLCAHCGAKRPPTKRPAHTAALDIPYEEYVRINGGDFCWIGRTAGLSCGRERDPTARRLNRDHDHKTGKPRGLLCGGRMGCNRRLGRVDNTAWLEAACAYLRR